MIITLLVYYPTLKNGFLTGWDDQWMVFSHYTERGWTVNNLWHIFTDFYGGQYAPLAFLSYLALYTSFGYDPFYFHMFSLLLHIGCVCLVWKLISSLLRVHGGVSEKQILYVNYEPCIKGSGRQIYRLIYLRIGQCSSGSLICIEVHNTSIITLISSYIDFL